MTRKKNAEKKGHSQEAKFEAVLLLCNDDINTFDYIIESLTELVNHSEQQATQCTFIAHHKGTAIIEKGDTDVLRQIKRRFSQRNITTIVESIS